MTDECPPLDVSSATLTAIARTVTGSPHLVIGPIQITTIHHSHEATAGVYRIASKHSVAGTSIPWSVVLKIVRPTPDSASLREVDAYRSGLLTDLPGIRAPHCYGVEQRTDRSWWLWLEELATNNTWPVARFALAARHFGQFNGTYVVQRPVPHVAWLNRDFLRSLVAQRQTTTVQRLQHPETWTHPLVRAMFPTPVAPRLLRLWAAHESLLAALEQMPRTFCHHDAWQPNLVVQPCADGGEQTIALDWALAGIGALGEELGQLVAGSLMLDEVPDSIAERLPEAAWEGYLAGLTDVGWRGDEKQVRLGYLASATLRWGLAPPGLTLALNESRHAVVEQQRGQPITSILARRARAAYALLDLAEEAVALMQRHG